MEKAVNRHLIGEILLNNGIITDKSLKEALDAQHREGGLLGMILLNEGLITEQNLKYALEKQAAEMKH